jgi:hypothetical protein
MHRRSLIPHIALIVTAFAGTAYAKPKVAVLGLEVIDDGSNLAASATLRAKQLTDRLRDQAQRQAGKFELAPNSDKDLLEMKLLSNCSDEAQTCMAEIGRELKADKLIYGKIERRNNGYEVSLKLLDTQDGAVDKTSSHTVPFADSNPDKLRSHASRMYHLLTGEQELGTIVVRVGNATSGVVYLDGRIRTKLAGGSATIHDVSAGRHAVAIDASGFRRYSRNITVASGRSSMLDITLTGDSAAASAARPGGVYRALAWAGGAVTLGSAGALTYFGLRKIDQEDKKDAAVREVQGLPPDDPRRVEYTQVIGDPDDETENVCIPARAYDGTSEDIRAIAGYCENGLDSAKLVNYVFIPATIAAGLATSFFIYKGYISPGSSPSHERTGTTSRRKKRSGPIVTVQPIIGPDGAAGSVRIEF